MSNTDFIKRPEYGSLGQRIMLKANYFNIKTTPNTVYHYKVTIIPEAPGRIATFLVEDAKEQCKFAENQILVYDGGDNLFTAALLDFDDELKIVISKSNKVKISKDTPFNIVLKLVNKIKSESLNNFIKGNTKLSNEVLTYLMCLDIIIKQKALEKYPVAKSTYYQPEISQEISRGLKVCQGFYQSCKPTCGKVLLNVDSASTVFYPSCKLIDFVFKCLGLRSTGDLKQGLRSNDISTLKSYVKGLDVEVSHRNRRFKIKDVSAKPAERITFNVGDKETNVAEYFKENITYSWNILHFNV
ncbi:hypothetical protein CONCODRAFT_12310 [Conidiobolus coronatus NRRL 28638]|uniref:PAZ domain-containing protein n=1 Tax=Conidiobolus coronatus (strain ATCC 28846 / CBS 209.66 / NRRL 28638) TaxID=796925 RepID=A0A137NT68_CONC2|nr:hypothetical protein CONCODRAFT_12310 [Conidiobolus coronatus NRRL 28638]|eukprot:KXN65963.1 hypothetical protein CONCODRAFT_12310 [Conidiobolus coronatus NRRL 28638]